MPTSPGNFTEPLKRKLLKLCALVEENARRCILSVRTRDRQAAQNVIEADHPIDVLEIEIEEHCVRLFQVGGLSASDVRYVVGILKINSDLERVGDLAANIARRVLSIGQHEQLALPNELMEIAERTLAMLTASLDALVHMDTGMAREVCSMDNRVDLLYRHMYDLVRDRIQANPVQTERLIHMLGLARSMERIADYSTNIAENVVFIHEGRIIRHGRDTEDSGDARRETQSPST
ncbi:phosphate signaling complex protein PhoU [bacterium]|nr:phosphate signaling complex protein PhoU [bacterium]